MSAGGIASLAETDAHSCRERYPVRRRIPRLSDPHFAGVVPSSVAVALDPILRARGAYWAGFFWPAQMNRVPRIPSTAG